MADKLDLDYEDDYEVSDSDEEYTQREQNLLKKVRKGKKVEESDEEVLRFEADSDFEEPNENDGLPDSRLWGKKKSNFYNTDFHDNDYAYNEKEEEIANLEQQEALEIQKRLASELNETDFNIDMFTVQTDKQEEIIEVNTATTTDLSDLSRKQKLALFKSEAPEFDGLINDFTNRIAEYKDLLHPTMKLFESINFSNHPFIDFIKCRSELILNYSANISFYLILKAKRVKVKNHPIVKRLVQFRQLICQLDDIFEYVIKPQIETLLSEMNNIDSEKSTKLKILENIKLKVQNILPEDEEEEEGVSNVINKPLFIQNDSESDDEKDESMDEEDTKVGGKREITRQIAKNKGLTATKRRELRNPRVKNKLKFKNAVKRRKGAVQPIRSKVQLYSGEATGIKTHVKRSVKIK